jgi:gamma-glutamylcyclotransferase (GGCT)/AIG2-like uncharacterized protein YtfP
MSTPAGKKFLLFVYGTFLQGERDHETIAGAERVGEARTREGYTLVEVGPLAGMIEGGRGAVAGDLYSVEYATLSACDVKRDHPRLFRRKDVVLADGQVAHAYFLEPEQVRGKRRIRGGDWRRRFEVKSPEPGPLVRWTRSRNSRG